MHTIVNPAPTCFEAWGPTWGACGHAHPTEYAAGLCAERSRWRTGPPRLDGPDPGLTYERTGSDRTVRPNDR